MGAHISGTDQETCFDAAKYINHGIEPNHAIPVTIK
jgi:hypothetical protein